MSERLVRMTMSDTRTRALLVLTHDGGGQVVTVTEQATCGTQSAVAADTHGDGLRARYQQEIEQLRALCEKGLLAMESSHRRIVREMEEKHRAEREQLRYSNGCFKLHFFMA